jgi:hypothetical protein
MLGTVFPARGIHKPASPASSSAVSSEVHDRSRERREFASPLRPSFKSTVRSALPEAAETPAFVTEQKSGPALLLVVRRKRLRHLRVGSG